MGHILKYENIIMSLKGSFEKRSSVRVKGVIIYSFTLVNDSWFGSETFDCMVCDGAGQQPWYFRDQKLKAGEAMRFDVDTINWQWCQGDFFAILGRGDKVKQSWQLKLKEYRPGECPECHGSHKCGHCQGQGFSFDFSNGVSMCPYCGGTGVCMTCEIPRRAQPLMSPQQSPMMGSTRKHHRPTAVIQNEINDVQRQIDQIDWDLKMRDIRGTLNDHSLFSAQNELRTALRIRLMHLQQELAEAYQG